MDYAIPTDDIFVIPAEKRIKEVKESPEQREAVKKMNEARVKTEDGCVASFVFKKINGKD